MKTLMRIVAPAALLTLGACYAKLDEPSIAVTQTTPSIPGLPPVAVTVPANIFPSFSFSVGDFPGSDETSKESSVVLNSASVAMTATSSSGSNFDGITNATLSVTPPSGSGLPTTAVATYVKGDATRGSLSADGRTITLTPIDSTNLLPYLTQKSISISLSGTGTPPGPVGGSWSADVTLDFHVVAQKNLP